MSELKILNHIGHHLNVVNLLGACTRPGGVCFFYSTRLHAQMCLKQVLLIVTYEGSSKSFRIYNNII